LAQQHAATKAIRPPLRWAGSKRKSIDALLSYIPPGVSHFIEPFSGSACISFAVAASRSVLGDINPRLIEFYAYLKKDPFTLYHLYSAIERSEQSYYDIRRRFNMIEPGIARAAYFLFLNRNCFNGIYRVNTRGDYNVPWGGANSGQPLQEHELVAASGALQETTITCADFEEVVRINLSSDSFVYLDPPYAQNESRTFSEYYERSFITSDWTRLARLLDEIDRGGAKFLLSYAGDGATIEALRSWSRGHIEVTRNVGGFRASRRKHTEFVASNV
jgi:DNA adenine methylase